MKLLYISCHSILAYDETKLFYDMGIDVFSLGSYIDPQNPHDPKRPKIDGLTTNPDRLNQEWNRDRLTKEQIAEFDAIMIMHMPQWIMNNIDAFTDKPIIWRTIGQSQAFVEKMLEPYRDRIKIVRYSPMEQNLPCYIGQDALIRFYKDEHEFSDWNGHLNSVLTVAQNMKQRNASCNFDVYNESTKPFERRLYGPNNEPSRIPGGLLSYDELKQAYRDHRCYFYTGTKPASYTLNFMEAWMTGIPIVAIGDEYGNHSDLITYEIPFLIQNGKNGFISNNPKELELYCQNLLNDKNLATKISKAGRESAIKLFGKQTIMKQWKAFFKELNLL